MKWVWYGMVWYGMVWYGMVWYGMVIVVSFSSFHFISFSPYFSGSRKPFLLAERDFFGDFGSREVVLFS